MKFTSFYANFIKAQGVPNLNLQHHKKLFNIVCVENQLKIVNDQTDLVKGTILQRHNEMLKHKLNQKLNGLTQGRPPHIVLQIMIEESELA